MKVPVAQRLKIYFGVVTLFCLVMANQAHSLNAPKPELTWLSIDWQPAWIHEGPLTGQGYAQTMQRMLREQLKGYTHVDRSVTNVRIYSVLQSREACFAASPYQGTDLQPEKRKGIIWSAPAYLYFYHGLIVPARTVHKIKRYEQNGFINFSELIKDTSITGAFQPGRSYSRWLNPIFEDEDKTKNLFKWSGETKLTQSMFKLIEAGRIDYFVDYVIMLKFHQATEGALHDHVYLPIIEHKDMFGLGAIACSDTDLGRQIIKDINKYLIKVRTQPVLMDINRKWLMPVGQEDRYWKTWEEEVLTRNK